MLSTFFQAHYIGAYLPVVFMFFVYVLSVIRNKLFIFLIILCLQWQTWNYGLEFHRERTVLLEKKQKVISLLNPEDLQIVFITCESCITASNLWIYKDDFKGNIIFANDLGRRNVELLKEVKPKLAWRLNLDNLFLEQIKDNPY